MQNFYNNYGIRNWGDIYKQYQGNLGIYPGANDDLDYMLDDDEEEKKRKETEWMAQLARSQGWVDRYRRGLHMRGSYD